MTPHEMAHIYADKDWPVVVLHHPVSFGPKIGPDRARCSCSDAECESQGKHPRTVHGLKEATTDHAVIDGWWRRWPSANVGLLTGVHFDVLDLDGDDALDQLESIEPTGDWSGPIVTTGRGVHLYVGPTGAGNRTALLPGIDWRGKGGYAAVPPSRHYLHGDLYQWGEVFTMDRPINPCPGRLASLVRREVVPARPAMTRSVPPAGQTSAADKRIAGACGRVAMAPEGKRNDLLFWAARNLGEGVYAGELDVHEVVSALFTAAARCVLGELEAGRTIKSGLVAAGVRWPA